jgi:uncharacterized LabA/DUF88 family protein
VRTTAIFVDAGYFFAAAAELACGHPVPRSKVECDYAGLVESLKAWTRERVSDEPVRLLRCYWYDGAPDGIPTDEHLRVPRLADVKLRLGRQTSAGQKGVDGLIILDLVMLANNGGLDTAFVVSGDEDLREACLAAQQQGVRVVLLGVPAASQAFNQADSLVREADEHHMLDAYFWTAHLTVRGAPRPPVFGAVQEGLPSGHPLRQTVKDFVRTLRERLPAVQVPAVVEARPALLRFVDAQLLTTAGQGELSEELKRQLRATFWEEWDAASGTT